MSVTTVLLLGALDLALIGFGLFPPKATYGDARVGWIPAEAADSSRLERCYDPGHDTVRAFLRNEDGVRSDASGSEWRVRDTTLRILVGGDSHTELCWPNSAVHFGVTQDRLTAMGHRALVGAFGAGKYSPLQAYLALREHVAAYDPDILILNWYTGNDFYDLLRIDDRPHFVSDGSSYLIAGPVWYQFDPPGAPPKSRVLYAIRRLGDISGIRRVALRIRYLREAASLQGEGFISVLGYMNDLRKATEPSLGYPQALAAQMLNQQLFFSRFPESEAESLRRAKHLLKLIRAENPHRALILSPIPSFQLATSGEDSLLSAVARRVGLDYITGMAQETLLHDALVEAAREAGWIIVDNLRAMRESQEQQALYNRSDFHIEPAASAIIGANQARRIASLSSTIRARRTAKSELSTDAPVAEK